MPRLDGKVALVTGGGSGLGEATVRRFAAEGAQRVDDVDAMVRRRTREIPLGRMGTPDDVASLVLFLASDESGWITGQTHVADGGITMAIVPDSRDGVPA